MHFAPITIQDLDDLKKLQPPDWSDIIPDITYYINAPFCHPVKAIIHNETAGIGAAIIYGSTAWLAHIIVHPLFRNQGTGLAIVNELLSLTRNAHVESCLLTATALGKPVYTKAGFRSISEYIFMNREKPWTPIPVSEHVMDFSESFRDQIYDLDKQVSGEDRKLLLSDFITGTKIYILNGTVLGYCIPRLKEGPIIAATPEAGLELMKVKYSTSDKAVIPVENVMAHTFLKQHGFSETETKGTRMVLGKDIEWQPKKLFSRAGGNFG